MTRWYSIISGVGFALLFAFGISGAISAHEGREVADGQYELVVGFLDEPAFVGEKNAVIVEVSQPLPLTGTPESDEKAEQAANPVLGLVETLQVDVIYGDQKLTLSLVPRFDQPGAYVGYFFPMAEGDYSFRVPGEIGGIQIDETCTSGPETFSPVESREPLDFPKAS